MLAFRSTLRRLPSLALTASLLAGAAGLAGCSSSEEPEADSPSGAPTTEQAVEVPTTVKPGRVTGQLSKKYRRSLVDAVAARVDLWLEPAYFEGDYPRTKFKKAYRIFTKRAKRDAKEGGLLTNAEIGKRVDSVTPIKRELIVDLFAPDGDPQAATVRFVVAMKLDGEISRRDRVTGQLYLTKESGHWKVFGYQADRRKA